MGVDLETSILPSVERAVAENLLDYVQAIQSVAPELQAQATACAGGIAAFTGVGSPLTTIKGAGPDIQDEDIHAAEMFFRRFSVTQIVFELAPWISEDSVARLLERGYRVVAVEDVVVRSQPFDAPMPLHRVEPISPGEWPSLQRAANEAPETSMWSTITLASAQVRGAICPAVRDESGERIGCAELFPVGEVVLFGNDATLKCTRGRGAQMATIQHRLREAAMRGVTYAVAEVPPGSSSERNYLRCGFQVSHWRSHYSRVIE